jgi:hypothetical protein
LLRKQNNRRKSLSKLNFRRTSPACFKGATHVEKHHFGEATGLPSRRLFLATGSASAVFGALGSAAQGGETSELLNLIEAHRSSYARLDDAAGVRNDIEEAVDEDRCKNPVLVPLSVMPNGDGGSGYYELGSVSAEEIRQGIRDTHENLRRIHCSTWSCVMFPDMAAAAERELDASQERAFQALADAEAAIEAHERNSGLTAAEEAVEAAEKKEFETRLSLAVYVPRNAAEANAKKEYIEKSPPFRDGWCSDSAQFVTAMIARIGESAGA